MRWLIPTLFCAVLGTVALAQNGEQAPRRRAPLADVDAL
jgi:hypothetical protein